MRKIFATFFVFFGSAFFAFAALPATLVPESQNRDAGFYGWEKRHALVLERNKKVKPEYVFIGDSITHHWGGEPAFASPRDPASWEKLFCGHTVTNLGFGFDYVDNAYYRVENGELDGISPRVVLINIGTNNIGHRGDSAEVCAANTRALVQLIQKKLPRAKILLLGVYPRKEKNLTKKIRENNQRLMRMANGRTVFYADPGKTLLLKNGQVDPACFRDNVHPNAEGYRRVAAEIEKSLAKIDPEYNAGKK